MFPMYAIAVYPQSSLFTEGNVCLTDKERHKSSVVCGIYVLPVKQPFIMFPPQRDAKGYRRYAK